MKNAAAFVKQNHCDVNLPSMTPGSRDSGKIKVLPVLTFQWHNRTNLLQHPAKPCLSSIRLPTGLRQTCGTISECLSYPITRFMTAVLSASDVSPAPSQSVRISMNVRDAGGGKKPPPKSVACTRSIWLALINKLQHRHFSA